MTGKQKIKMDILPESENIVELGEKNNGFAGDADRPIRVSRSRCCDGCRGLGYLDCVVDLTKEF